MAGKQVYDAAFAQALGAVERGLVPDAVVRAGIRWLLTQRKREVRWCDALYRCAGAVALFGNGVLCIGQAAALCQDCAAWCVTAGGAVGHAASAELAPTCTMPPHAMLCSAMLCCLQTTASGEDYYRRLQAFRDELAGMPVAVQASCGIAGWGSGAG